MIYGQLLISLSSKRGRLTNFSRCLPGSKRAKFSFYFSILPFSAYKQKWEQSKRHQSSFFRRSVSLTDIGDGTPPLTSPTQSELQIASGFPVSRFPISSPFSPKKTYFAAANIPRLAQQFAKLNFASDGASRSRCHKKMPRMECLFHLISPEVCQIPDCEVTSPTKPGRKEGPRKYSPLLFHHIPKSLSRDLEVKKIELRPRVDEKIEPKWKLSR